MGQLFDTAQGVTPGGEGCLDLFLLEASQAEAAGSEPDLIHPVAKGTDIERYRCNKTGNVILYPYISRNDAAKPAFDMALWRAMHQIAQPRGVGSLTDWLDFTTAIDSQEERYRNGAGSELGCSPKTAEPPKGAWHCRIPKRTGVSCQPLQCSGEVRFEKRRITASGKQWYEYHRPRDIAAMLKKPKLLSPRLTPKVRFTLDRKGIVPQDSCIALVTTTRQGMPWQDFTNEISKVLGAGLRPMGPSSRPGIWKQSLCPGYLSHRQETHAQGKLPNYG